MMAIVSLLFPETPTIARGEAKSNNHRTVASHLQTLSHNVVSSTPRHKRDWNSYI